MMMTFLVMMIPPPEDGGKNAFGQVTITKKDDEGRALDGAVFKIDIVFSNGSTGGQSRFEVTDGQRTYYYNHPKGDTDPATVTVTETQAPENYKIIEKDNNRMIVIQRGEDAVMKVPNEKHGSLIIYKMSSFRPQKESIIFCNAYGFAYFKLASLR